MKPLHVLPRLLLFALLLPLLPAQAQVADATKLASILQASRKDSVQKIERLAAVKFHKLINAYRISSGVDSLRWDDTLWLAARNHSQWMKANNELSHGETKATTNYTGESPGARYNYASKGNGNCSWSGENALYNYNNDGRTIDEIAEDMATNSLSQWQHSPGHNRNMLAAGSKVHGVAFVLGNDGRTWSTDLFAYRYYSDAAPVVVQTRKENPVATVTANTNSTKVLPSASNKIVKMDLVKTGTDISSALYEKVNGNKSRNATYEKAAMNHAEYMAYTKQASHTEKKKRRHYTGETVEKRLMKASSGKYFFAKHRWNVTESIAVVEADAASMDIPSLVNEIATKLDADGDAANAERTGFGVVIKRVKNRLTIYVVRLAAVRK